MSESNIILVVAAVIRRAGKILICQRKNAGRHALKWEFPGGKVEAGESPSQALQRELREELGIDAAIGDEIARYDFEYGPGAITRLIFFAVTEYAGEPQNLDFTQFVWETPVRLPAYDFLEGDVEFVKQLAQLP